MRNISDPSFYGALSATVIRMLKGLVTATVIALPLGILSGMNDRAREYLDPFVNVIKTIPNVSYIIIILILMGGENSVTVITFFILFPTLFSSILMGTGSVPEEIIKISMLEPLNTFQKIRYVYWPFMFPYLLNGLKTAFGLGFKVSIMAEILGAIKVGVGREMSIARTYVEMDVIFAWTIWIIIISLLTDAAFDSIMKKLDD